MKPTIAIFGLPSTNLGQININIYKKLSNNSSYGDIIFSSNNNMSGFIFEDCNEELKPKDALTIVIVSSGLVPYSYELLYNGADISHVPFFKKDTNTTKELIKKNWNINEWQKWNPSEQNKLGLDLEKKYILKRQISVAPIWESYYIESNVDYLEKFHTLWIGLNSYASHFSTENNDRDKILKLVDSNLRYDFNTKLAKLSNLESEKKWQQIMTDVGVNMTSEIVRDEINKSYSALDFLEISKNAKGLLNLKNELDGLIFLDKDRGKEVFQNIFSKYHQHMASEEQMTNNFNLKDAFQPPKCPESVIRKGRLVYHNPFKSNADGTLFKLVDFFDSTYANSPYCGQPITNNKNNNFEATDPLFFKYLLTLYKFRCAYFHGELPLNKRTDDLAKAAYFSLYDLFSSIL